MRFGSKCAGLLSVQSNWLSMNHVTFQLGESIFCHLAQQQQIEVMLETSQSPAVDGNYSATGRILQIFEEVIYRKCSVFHLEPEKTNFE
jgi:hypothetical protein